MAPPEIAARRRRRLGRGARWSFAVGSFLLLVGLLFLSPGPEASRVVATTDAAGGGGGTTGGLPTENLTVNLTDAPAFSPSYLTVSAPLRLNLTIVNSGTLNHTFTLVNRPNFLLNRSWTPEELSSYFAANGSQANLDPTPGNRTTVALNFTGAQAGYSYEFVSVVPYQFQAGMFGFLNVTGRSTGGNLVANVSASATAFAFLPDAVEINASSFPITVTMEISNLGTNAHTFWLASQSNLTLNPGNFTQYFQQHPPLASVNIPTQSGVVVWANFTIASAGTYEYICTIPGHFAGGMYGYLYVGIPLPVATVPPSTAIVDSWVLYGGAGLLGLGAILAAAALLVGRFPKSPGSGGH